MIGAGLLASIPAPSVRDLEIGPLQIRLYALCLLAGIVVAAYVCLRRWQAKGGDPELIFEVTLWSVAGGLVGGRLYHDITSWDQLGDEWYAPFAIWEGGLGIWGAIALGVLVGTWITRRRGASVLAMMDAAAPGLLIAQGIGRLGNYFNQELFGSPTSLPWALEVDPDRRPDDTFDQATYHPTFLYEMLWNFAGAALIIWAGKRFRLRPPGVFCLYVAVYCAGRIIWEQLRVDPSHHFLGQRINFYVAVVLLVGALIAFWWSQRRDEPQRPVATAGARGGSPAGGAPAQPRPATEPPRERPTIKGSLPPLPERPGGARARPARRRKR